MEDNHEKLDKKVIVVDDDKINLKIIAKVVNEYFEYVEQADSGSDLIEKIKNDEYDLIITDDMMPGKSGTETMQYLKNEMNIDIPIIVLTSNTVDGAKEFYLNAGFDYYLEKPIDREKLTNSINKFF